MMLGASTGMKPPQPLHIHQLQRALLQQLLLLLHTSLPHGMIWESTTCLTCSMAYRPQLLQLSLA
jgi:hypothetical protein